MKSTVRCRKCDQRIWQKDRALHTMGHYNEFDFDARKSWYAYQKAEKKCFGSIRGWKGEPTKEWLHNIYESPWTVKK